MLFIIFYRKAPVKSTTSCFYVFCLIFHWKHSNCFSIPTNYIKCLLLMSPCKLSKVLLSMSQEKFILVTTYWELLFACDAWVKVRSHDTLKVYFLTQFVFTKFEISSISESASRKRGSWKMTLLQNESMRVQQKKASSTKAAPKPLAVDSKVNQAVKEGAPANPKKQITYIEFCHYLI